jgi:hypothetical protein
MSEAFKKVTHTNTMTKSLTDNEWQRVQADLREWIDPIREANDVVVETDDILIVSDWDCLEYNEIAKEKNVCRGAVSERMHIEARQHYESETTGDMWSIADPVVIHKA